MIGVSLDTHLLLGTCKERWIGSTRTYYVVSELVSTRTIIMMAFTRQSSPVELPFLTFACCEAILMKYEEWLICSRQSFVGEDSSFPWTIGETAGSCLDELEPGWL